MTRIEWPRALPISQWRRRSVLEVSYVSAVTAVSIVGMSSPSLRPVLLVATLMSLPCGFGALIGLYVDTGLFNWVGNGFSNSYSESSSSGCNAAGQCWSHSSGSIDAAHGLMFSLCVVTLFAIAAWLNVYLLSVRRARMF